MEAADGLLLQQRSSKTPNLQPTPLNNSSDFAFARPLRKATVTRKTDVCRLWRGFFKLSVWKGYIMPARIPFSLPDVLFPSIYSPCRQRALSTLNNELLDTISKPLRCIWTLVRGNRAFGVDCLIMGMPFSVIFVYAPAPIQADTFQSHCSQGVDQVDH
jgi:hypothetical protein